MSLSGLQEVGISLSEVSGTTSLSIGSATTNLLASSSTLLPSKLVSSWCSSNSVSSLSSASSRIVSGMARSVFWKACSAAAFFAISVFLYLNNCFGGGVAASEGVADGEDAEPAECVQREQVKFCDG